MSAKLQNFQCLRINVEDHKMSTTHMDNIGSETSQDKRRQPWTISLDEIIQNILLVNETHESQRSYLVSALVTIAKVQVIWGIGEAWRGLTQPMSPLGSVFAVCSGQDFFCFFFEVWTFYWSYVLLWGGAAKVWDGECLFPALYLQLSEFSLWSNLDQTVRPRFNIWPL